MGLEVVERNIPLSNIRPGMLISLNYTKVAGGGGNYFVFVINPNLIDIRSSSPQLHAYNFGGAINESQFINILVNLSAALVVDTVNKELRLEAISDTEAYEAKYLILSTGERPYKRFNISGIGTATQFAVVLPEVLDEILSGTIKITNQSSKRKLFTSLQQNDIESLKEIPEIQAALLTPRTQETAQQEEEAERENVRQPRRRSLMQVLRSFFQPRR
jgi:hypothetical protein